MKPPLTHGKVIWLCFFLFVNSAIADGGLRVFRSLELSDEEALKEIESQKDINNIEISLLRERQKQINLRKDRMDRLYQSGASSKFDRDLSSISNEDVSDLVQVQSHYGELLNALYEELSLDHFEPLPSDKQSGEPELDVRVPGLSLRVGGTDFFTVRVKAKSAITHANKKYTAARLKESFAPPHKSVFHEFFGDRLAKLSGMSFARNTEIERTGFYVSMVKHLQLLTNHRFAKRWRKGQRIEQYNQFVESYDAGGETLDTKSFAGAEESFWLFGDGAADAQSTSPLSTSDVHFSGRRAESRHAEFQAKSNYHAAKRRYDRLKGLQSRGYSNASELREAELMMDISEMDLKKIQARQLVAKMEFEQLKAAVSSDSDFSASIPLPSANGLSRGDGKIWYHWLSNSPPVVSHEILRFCELLKSRFQSGAELRIAQRRTKYEEDRLNRYRSLDSVYAKEVEMQLDRVTAMQTDLAGALEAENLSILKLQQWAYRVYRRERVSRPPNPEKMVAIMEAGKAVNAAREEVARIEMMQRKRKYQYDIDYYERLRKVQNKGAASSYETARAKNQFLRSKGRLYTSIKNFAVVKQQAKFVKVLYESGSMSYGEGGLEITRFMPEAGEELEKLTILRDSADKGKILEMEANLANSKLRIEELNRLIEDGHASPVELEFANVKRKQIENSLAMEKVRDGALVHALDIVKALEFEPDTEQELKPSDEVKL